MYHCQRFTQFVCNIWSTAQNAGNATTFRIWSDDKLRKVYMQQTTVYHCHNATITFATDTFFSPSAVYVFQYFYAVSQKRLLTFNHNVRQFSKFFAPLNVKFCTYRFNHFPLHLRRVTTVTWESSILRVKSQNSSCRIIIFGAAFD